NEDRLPLANRLRRLLSGSLLTRPALFVFDDFEQNAELDAAGLPRFDSAQRLLVRPAALDILRALRTAIRETNSASRILVTCRYDLPEPRGLKGLVLDGLKQADLDKKLMLLDAVQQRKDQPEITRRVKELAGGNPRLLERLDRVLQDAETDENAIFE